jgi:hypothetical protein
MLSGLLSARRSRSPSDHQHYSRARQGRILYSGLPPYCASPYSSFRSSQRIEPCQQIGISLPPWRFRRSQLWVHLFQCFPLRLQIRLRVVVRCIQVGMTEPTPNDRDIHASSNQVDRG